MANEWTLWIAILAAVEADTDPGGLVPLIGKAKPVVRWGDPGMNERPIILATMGSRSPLAPTQNRYRVPVTLEVYAAGGSGDLAIRILDRLELVLKQPILATYGIDAARFVRRRITLSQLERGSQREAIDIDFLMTR